MMQSYYERVGYETLGPILYAFSRWIYTQKNNDEKLFFLSREGKLLKQAYELLTGEDTSYLYVSRHSVNVPLFTTINQYDDLTTVGRDTIRRYCTIREFCEYLEVYDNTEVRRIINERYDENHRLESIKDKDEFLKRILGYVHEKAEEQSKNLSEYLINAGFSKKNVLVDVGWAGTTQTCLELLKYNSKDIEWNVRGLYLGYRGKKKDDEILNSKKTGFLFNEEWNSGYGRLIRFTLAFFELLFMSTEGTTKSYQKRNGKVEPVLAEYENDKVVELYIGQIQSGALKYISDAKNKNVNLNDIIACPEEAFKNYKQFAECPTQDTLNHFSLFNANDGHDYRIIGDKSIGYYLRHPKAFICDFEENKCKLWFLKNVFKIPFPYINVLGALARIVERSK